MAKYNVNKNGYILSSGLDSLVIPTNVGWKRGNQAIMGAGLVRKIADKDPSIIDGYGTFCYNNKDMSPFPLYYHDNLFNYRNNSYKLILAPTKSLNRISPWLSWQDDADLKTVEESLHKLSEVPASFGSIALPLLGCDKEGLDPKDVVPLLHKYLDERFTVFGDLSKPRIDRPKPNVMTLDVDALSIKQDILSSFASLDINNDYYCDECTGYADDGHLEGCKVKENFSNKLAIQLSSGNYTFSKPIRVKELHFSPNDTFRKDDGLDIFYNSRHLIKCTRYDLEVFIKPNSFTPLARKVDVWTNLRVRSKEGLKMFIKWTDV